MCLKYDRTEFGMTGKNIRVQNVCWARFQLRNIW